MHINQMKATQQLKDEHEEYHRLLKELSNIYLK
jgi:hypothetical protein